MPPASSGKSFASMQGTCLPLNPLVSVTAGLGVMAGSATMTSEEMVIQAVSDFADQCHGEQIRRYTGERYIVHPIRVMKACAGYTGDVAVLSAALLHDVLEDTPTTADELLTFLSGMMSVEQAQHTLTLVIELTDEFIKEKYPKWNRRKRKNKEGERLASASSEAQTIKYADIMDNAPEITEKDPAFAERFLKECRGLIRRMKKGNIELREQAIDTVNDCLLQLERRDQ